MSGATGRVSCRGGVQEGVDGGIARPPVEEGGQCFWPSGVDVGIVFGPRLWLYCLFAAFGRGIFSAVAWFPATQQCRHIHLQALSSVHLL